MSDKKIETIDGYCPNCWGRQVYQDQIIDKAKEARVDLNNVDQYKGWIQGYAAKFLTGLKIDGKGTCPSCGVG